MTRIVGAHPTLVLGGNLHAVKEVRWQSGKDKPFLAERLVCNGQRVASVVQQWETRCSNGSQAEFVTVGDSRAEKALEKVVRPAAVGNPEPSRKIDAAILWRCRRYAPKV